MTALKRYHLDDGSAEPSLNLVDLQTTVHALYTHWVRGNAHRRDFVCAMLHAAELAYLDYVMSGKPSLSGDRIPLVNAPLAVPRAKPADAPALRFYDELDALNPDIDVSKHIPALAPLFIGWVQDGFAARDFCQVVQDVAKVVVYDHHLAEQLGGLGGGKDGLKFLTTAYKA